VIEAEKATYTVSRMCGLLEVSRSGFYKWRKSRDGGLSPSRHQRAELDAKVADFHQASDGVYGAPRILADLRAAGAGKPVTDHLAGGHLDRGGAGVGGERGR
jgi:hypothetical protein